MHHHHNFQCCHNTLYFQGNPLSVHKCNCRKVVEMYAYSCLCAVAYNQGLACGPAILWRVYTLFWLARYNTHKMLFESLILGITNKNLRSNKSSPWFIILLINHRPSYQQRMKSCMNLNFVYLCCINILICVLYLLACYIYLYMMLCPFCKWSNAYFLKNEKKERKKKKEKKREKIIMKKKKKIRHCVTLQINLQMTY